MEDTDTRDDGLTAAERAEVEADAKGDDAKTETKAEATETVVEPAKPEPDAHTRALTEVTAKLAQATEALAAASRKDEPVEETPAEPNFDKIRAELRQVYEERDSEIEAQIADLDAKFKSGDIDEDDRDRQIKALKREQRENEKAYDDAREDFFEKKSDYVAQRRAAEAAKATAEQQAQKDWDGAVAAFLKDADNAKLLEDATRKAAFAATTHIVAKEEPGLSYAELLTKTKERILKSFGITQTEDQKKKDAIAKAKAERETKSGKAPPDLNNVPSAGSAKETASPYADLDDLDINSLENTLAHMKEDKIREYLESAPGGLRDNPRAA